MNGNSRNAGTAEQRGEILLDVIGQRCPLPVLWARKRLLRLEPGQLVRVFASDPVARIDMPHFCVEFNPPTIQSLRSTRQCGC